VANPAAEGSLLSLLYTQYMKNVTFLWNYIRLAIITADNFVGCILNPLKI
jgi:hypothetical protein